ncbi:MAG: DUF6489 family protein, partial [Novosphingobium sp.]
GSVGMKVNVEVDCTPDEARRFLGLPDVTPLNEAYVENLKKAMSGATSIEQMQELVKSFAPMGQMGMALFQNILDGSTAFAESAGVKKKG